MATLPSTPASSDTLEEQLKKKQAAFDSAQGQLKTLQDQLNTLTRQMSGLQTDIKGLQTQLADLQQTTGGYGKTSRDQQNLLDKDQKVIATKENIAQAVLKDLTKDIDKIVSNFDTALDKKRTDSKAARKEADDAATAARAANDDAQAKQTAFDNLKSLPKANDSKLKDIGTLLDQVSKAEAENCFAAMYFLANEAGTEAGQVKMPSADDYANQVRKAQQDATDAKADADAKKSNADRLMTAWQKLRDAVVAAEKSRRADLLDLLKDVKPKAA